MPLEATGRGALTSLLVDAYLVVGVGNHSVIDNMHGVDVPTSPEVVPNKPCEENTTEADFDAGALLLSPRAYKVLFNIFSIFK